MTPEEEKKILYSVPETLSTKAMVADILDTLIKVMRSSAFNDLPSDVQEQMRHQYKRNRELLFNSLPEL